MQGERLPTRVSSACERCRRQKQRCDNSRPCSNCIKAKCECITAGAESQPKRAPKRPRTSYAPNNRNGSSHDAELEGRQSPTGRERTNSSPWGAEQSIVTEFGNSDSAMDITRRVLQSHRSPESRATFAIPGGDFRSRRYSVEAQYSVSDLIETDLPPRLIMDRLLDVYFFTVHWFSLVVYEPAFRQRYENIVSTGVARSTDRPFLLLLLMVLVMACHYGRSIHLEEFQQVNLDELRIRYLEIVRQNFMDLLDEDSLEFVQICTLLGSYWLYWGKPRSSFTILGAAVKSAQAISLHRQPGSKQSQKSQQSVEEHKRVWWTIYTWDRFATIVYGRPLGINDRDCDVPMPATFTERLVDIQASETANVELSSYQTNLNRVYQIASPLLENIYSIRIPAVKPLSEMAATVKQIDQAMRQWQHDLPSFLKLDTNPDLPIRASLSEKMHQLQALSLRLTHLNLTIIIHRPLLADRCHKRDEDLDLHSTNASSNGADKQIYDSSFDECLSAALHISRLGQSKPNLILLAGKTHLLSFLAMNIFTSSVVLFICALLDVLSNSAQEAKRGMSRNLKILKSLPHAGSLSNQCSMIVGDLIHIILEKEKDEMLLGPFHAEDEAELPLDSATHHYDHSIIVPLDPAQRSGFSTRRQSRDLTESATSEVYGSGFGKTMQQLHRVLKDASHSRVQQRADAPSQPTMVDRSSGVSQTPDPGWLGASSWSTGQVMGSDSYAQDMSQFWLWDFEPSYDSITDWPPPSYNG